MSQSLRELGMDLFEDQKYERALGVFSEAVRRNPADHRSRMLAAVCFDKLGERERAVTVLHSCAEGLIRRDYLLSAIAACRLALQVAPNERRVHDTLARLHSRAARAAPGRALVPPPLPPETLYDGNVSEDLMTLSGDVLSQRAIEVLAAPDTGGSADAGARPPLPLFADLPRAAFIGLVGLMGYRRAKADEAICREGEGGEAIYVVVAGKCEATRTMEGEKKTLAFLSGGSIFGEMSLLTGASPTVTVTTVADTDFFEIRREHLNQLAKAHPEVTQALADFAQQRMGRNLTATSPLFQQVPEKDRAELLRRFTFRALQPGERVLVEGDHAQGLFLVLAGELVVQKEDPAGGMVSLGVLREGDIAGEISLLTGLRATATVVATRKTATAYLERGQFAELTKTFPQTKAYLQQLSERRLKQIGDALRPAEILDADELVVDAS